MGRDISYTRVGGPLRLSERSAIVIAEIPMLLRMANVLNKTDFQKFLQEHAYRPLRSHRNNAEPYSEFPEEVNTKVSIDNQLIVALAVLKHYSPVMHRHWWEIEDVSDEINRVLSTIGLTDPVPFDTSAIYYDPNEHSRLHQFISEPLAILS